jgi:hypothetical protein
MSERAMGPVERAEAELAAIQEEINSLTSDQTSEVKAIEKADAEQGQQAPPSDEAPPAQTTPADDDFRQKYFALQGMFKGQQRQIEQMTEQHNQLLKQVNQKQAAPSTSPESHHAHLEGLVEEFGQPMLEAIKQITMATFGDKISAIEQKLNSINSLSQEVETFKERQTQSDSEQFMGKLSARMPDWQEVYHSEKFTEWKDSVVEPYTARTFGDLFEEANQKWNADSMIGIFNAFKAAGVPNNNRQPQQKQSVGAQDPRESLVTPGSQGTAGTAPSPTQPKVWTSAEVDTAYDNMRRGKYSPEEAARVEREIYEANAQGRIV